MKIYKKNSAKAGPTTETKFFWTSPQLRKKLNWNETPIGCIMTRSAGTRSGLWVKQSRKVTARTIFVFQRSERPWLFYEGSSQDTRSNTPYLVLIWDWSQSWERIRFQVPHHFKCPREPGAEILYFQIFRSWWSPTKQQGLSNGIRF